MQDVSNRNAINFVLFSELIIWRFLDILKQKIYGLRDIWNPVLEDLKCITFPIKFAGEEKFVFIHNKVIVSFDIVSFMLRKEITYII